MDAGMIVALMLLGGATGFAAGLLGIGGGTILVPLLTIIFSAHGFATEHVVHMAIATSLAVIFFTSISSVLAHQKRRAILWPVALMLIPGVMLGSWFGPVIAAYMNTRFLSAFFGLFVTLSAVRVLYRRKATIAGKVPGTLGMSAAGMGIGMLSGLVGAGGGFITVPFLVWCGISIHNAVATSAVMGFPIALSGTLSNIYQGWGLHDLPDYSLGYIYLPALLCVAFTSVFSAPWGARTAHRMDVKNLRLVFSYLLLILAAYMFWKAASA